MSEEPEVRHDPEADALYVRFAAAPVARTAPLDDDRIVDYAADGSVVGVELLSVSHGSDIAGLPHAAAVERALRRLGLPIADPAAAARARAALRARDAFARAIAEAVRRYRAAHRLSHRAFGRKVGMAGSDVARLERGEHAPSIDLLDKLARELGMHFVIEVAPVGAAAAVLPPGVEVLTERAPTPGGSRVVVAAG
ncbi:MAG TPA: DUF2283 domain-containing protein [Chloroflexota bacterium]|jgi:uncharacterized protein YuzE/DNA-binding XRE family transcriptional regulator